VRKLPIILLLVLSGVFAFGLARLLKWRFEAGDVYPEYSSLRTDPLGAKALYESLDSLLDAGRNYRPFSRLNEGRGATLFYLGAHSTFMFHPQSDLRLPAEEFDSLETFVRDGGRLVVSLFPTFQTVNTNRLPPKPVPAPAIGPSGKTRKANPPAVTPRKGPLNNGDEWEDFRTVSVRERWGVEYKYDALLQDENNVYKPEPAFSTDVAGLPERISCHTALYFDNLTNGWRVIYQRKKSRPVIIERKIGAGSVVLSADSYLFSNEALWKERSPALLAWMVGPSERVVFDETHLGVEESSGVSALARKYRLHGLLGALLLLAGLFVWKNVSSFLPPYEDSGRNEDSLITGKDSASGFVNLLRRNLPAREILAIGLTEWKKSCAREQPKARLEQVQAIIDAENAKETSEQNPIQTYRAIARALSKRTAK